MLHAEPRVHRLLVLLGGGIALPQPPFSLVRARVTLRSIFQASVTLQLHLA